MLEERLRLVAVGVVENERLVRVIGDDADRGTHVTAEVERVENEPLAPALRRLEAIESEAFACLRVSGCSELRRHCCCGERCEQRCVASAKTAKKSGLRG